LLTDRSAVLARRRHLLDAYRSCIMRTLIATLALGLVLGFGSAASAQDNPVVVMETSLGAIVIELWEDRAPATVENFLRYADSGYYDGLIFHRVISGFMIQGGGFDADMVQKTTFDPIINEARADTPNNRGTIAMARTSDINSATSQFFINHADNDFLNHTDETMRGFGYAVFGMVVEGIEVVDAIAAVETGDGPRGLRDVPMESVMIVSVERR